MEWCDALDTKYQSAQNPLVFDLEMTARMHLKSKGLRLACGSKVDGISESDTGISTTYYSDHGVAFSGKKGMNAVEVVDV